MFSLALKNAILMILIILIIHFLIKNYLENRSLPFSQLYQVQRPAPVVATQQKIEHVDNRVLQEDEDELYKFVFKTQDNIALNKNTGTSAPLPPPFNSSEPFIQPGSDLLGTFSKCDYSKFGSPI